MDREVQPSDQKPQGTIPIGVLPMKVCIVTTTFPRWKEDDQGTFVVEQAKALRHQGASVQVIGPHAPGASQRQTLHGIDVIRPRYAWPEGLEILRKYRAGLPVILRRINLAWLLIPLFMLTQWLALLRYTKGVDVIHANWTLSAFSAILVKPFRHIPVVVTVQGSDIYETERIQWLRWVTRAVLKRVDQVIALSSPLAALTKNLGVHEDRIRILPNGVDVEYFMPPEAERDSIILFVGSLVERKGVRDLVEATPRVLQALPDYRVVIIGEGPQRESLESRSVDLGLKGRIEFLGVKRPSEVRYWMQKSKLLALPSREEGQGVVLLEAMACGTPCVASEVGGIPDVINESVGRLVPPGEPEKLANAVVATLQDPTIWQSYHEQARRYVVKRFSWQALAKELLLIYDDLQRSGSA